MTQTQMVLDALRRGPLTPLEALERFGVFRLAARCHELREQGHAISVERLKLPNGKRVARYYIGRP
jgi:hypothetical protein